MLATNKKPLREGAYNCRFAEECNEYNPADTLPVTLTCRGQRVGAHTKYNICTHGGGSGCKHWRSIVDRKILRGIR